MVKSSFLIFFFFTCCELSFISLGNLLFYVKIKALFVRQSVAVVGKSNLFTVLGVLGVFLMG